MGVSMEFQECSKEVLKLFKGVLRVFQGNIKEVKMMF